MISAQRQPRATVLPVTSLTIVLVIVAVTSGTKCHLHTNHGAYV